MSMYETPARSDELYHHGIKGMHWGIRRYQPYPSGSSGIFKKAKRKEHPMLDKSIKQGKGRDNASPAEVLTKETNKTVQNTSKGVRTIGGIQKDMDAKRNNARASAEVSKMSDTELRNRINRMQMERQYKSLTASDTKNGWEKAAEILDVLGSITAIAVSAATVGTTINQLRKK